MNKFIGVGNLGKDPEVRTTNSGKSVMQVSLAIPRRFNKDVTDWINLVAWEKTAEFIEKYFKKGSKIAVVGEVQTRSYKNKEGQTVNVTEVLVDEAYFCESKKTDTYSEHEEVDESNLPF